MYASTLDVTIIMRQQLPLTGLTSSGAGKGILLKEFTWSQNIFPTLPRAGWQSVMSLISYIFDSCSGGITSSGTTANNPNAIVFRCFQYKIFKPKGAGNTQGVQSRKTMMACP
jgi:hypothetical protein